MKKKKKRKQKEKARIPDLIGGKADSQIKFLEDKRVLFEESLPRNILCEISMH